MQTPYALVLALVAGQDPVFRAGEVLTLELADEVPLRIELALDGRAGFISIESTDCDVRAALGDEEPLDLDQGRAFDELIEVRGSEFHLRVAGSGGALLLRWVAEEEWEVTTEEEIEGFARFLAGGAPAHEKRAAIGEVFLFGRRARDAASEAELVELGTALGGAVLSGEERVLAAWTQSLLGVYLEEITGELVPPTRWLETHVAAAQAFQWAGEYRYAGWVLAAAGPRVGAVGGALAVEFGILQANSYVHLGHHERGAQHCDRVAELLTQVELGENRLIAIGQLASIRFRLGQYGAVRALLAEGFAITGPGDPSPESLTPLWEIAALIARQEGHHGEAARAWGRLVAAASDPLSEAGYRVNRGRELRESGDLEGARADFDRALELALEDGLRHIEAAARDGLARVHLERGETLRARAQVQAALGIERADELVDYLGHTLQTLALLGLAEGDLASTRRAMAEAEGLLSPRGLTPRGLAELRSRYSFWSAIAQDLIAVEHDEGASAEERAATTREGLWYAGQWSGRAMLSAMRTRAREGSDLGLDQVVEALAPALGSARALIRFAPGAEVLRAYLVHGDRVRLVELGERAAIEASASRYLEQVCCGRPETWAAADVAEMGHDLYRRVLEPVLAHLDDDVETLVIVPSEALAGVPFEALVTSAPPVGAASFEDLSYLVERYSVTYTPSVPILAHLRGLPERAGERRALYLGDTIVPREWGGVAVSHRLSEEVNHLQPLDQTRDEVVALAWESIPRERRGPHYERHDRILAADAPRGDLWQTEWFDLHLGARACPAVLKGDLGAYDLIHIACHSFCDAGDPAHQGLVLSGAAQGEDGLVDLAEIRACAVNAELVVLAGCETGSGQVLGGEGVQSIAAAFLEAGARSVVASLWPVEDDGTEFLMVRFGEGRSRGLPAPSALESAKRAVWTRPLGRGPGVRPRPEGDVQDPDPRHPYYWAPFIFIGGTAD